MRITNQAMLTNYQNSLNRQLKSMNRVSEQYYTGVLVSKSSQDPYAYNRIRHYREEISRKEQYVKNAKDLANQYEQYDISLTTVTDAFKRIKELAVTSSSETNTGDAREVAAIEIETLLHTIVDALNVSVDGKYLFAGNETSTQPFDLNHAATGGWRVDYRGDTNYQAVEIGKGQYINKNMLGSDLFVPIDGGDAFESINSLMEYLKNDDTAGIKKIAEKIDDHQQTFLDMRTKVGTNQNRMEMLDVRYGDEIETLTELLSNLEDTDISAKYIELTSMNVAYTASLQLSNYIVNQTNLFSYIK